MLINETSRPRCHCGTLDTWARDPAVPIEYDAALDEYHLLTRQKGYKMIYFCPFCGGRAPPSQGGALFMEPSRQEMAAIDARLAGALTVADVIQRLGEPDRRFGPVRLDALTREIYGVKNVKQQLDYWSLADTVEVCIQEYENGDISISFSGKRKDTKSGNDRALPPNNGEM